MKEEKRKKESGWLIEDDELDNVSGGMTPFRQDVVICPRCGHGYGAARNKSVSECTKCGCRWDISTGEILN